MFCSVSPKTPTFAVYQFYFHSWWAEPHVNTGMKLSFTFCAQVPSASVRRWPWGPSPRCWGPSDLCQRQTSLPALTVPRSSTPPITSWSSPTSTWRRSTTCVPSTLRAILTGRQHHLPRPCLTSLFHSFLFTWLCIFALEMNFLMFASLSLLSQSGSGQQQHADHRHYRRDPEAPHSHRSPLRVSQVSTS